MPDESRTPDARLMSSAQDEAALSHPAKPSRRKLLTAGAALAAVAAAPAPAPADAPDADAELVQLADLAIETARHYCAALSNEVHIPPAVDAELDRLSALQRAYCLTAARVPAHPAARRRARAQVVALANSYALSAEGDPGAVVLRSFLDDAMGGEGAGEAFFDDVFGRGREGAI